MTERLTPLLLKWQFVLEAIVELIMLKTKIREATAQVKHFEMLRPRFEMFISQHRQEANQILKRTQNLFAEPLRHKLAEFIERAGDGDGTGDEFKALLFDELLPSGTTAVASELLATLSRMCLSKGAKS